VIRIIHVMTSRMDILADQLKSRKRTTLSLDGFRKAAVLVPLVPADDGFNLLFTKRTDSVETHKGQISFPGGMVDASDRDMIDTALREAREEVGIAAEEVTTIGLLDDIATPVGFVITPVVGLLASSPKLSLNTVEVAEVFEVPVSFFADPASGTVGYREANGRRYEVWSFDTGTHVIWGATANIVRMLIKTMRSS